MEHITDSLKSDHRDDPGIDDLEMAIEELSDDRLEFIAGGMPSRSIQPTYRDGDPLFMDGCIP